jgi:hypothetical protein
MATKRKKNSVIGRRSAGRANSKVASDLPRAYDSYRDVDRACMEFFRAKGMPCGGFADYSMKFGAKQPAAQ